MTPSAAAAVLAVRLPSDVPVAPDADTARRWLERELADPVYHRRPSLLETVLEWVLERLAEAQQATSGLDPRVAATVVVGTLVAGVVVALVVAGPVRRARRARRPSVDVFGDDTRSAEQMRASADDAARRGDWSTAVLERFRAVLRSLEERTVLDDRPGRTADEGAVAAGHRLPGSAAELLRAARLFDDVCYGDAIATGADDAVLRELDRRVAAERPVDVAGAVPEAVA